MSFLSRLVFDHFAHVGSKYGIFSILQLVTYTQMSTWRYGNLVLACDFAENHSPDYVSKCLSTSRGDYFCPGGLRPGSRSDHVQA